MEIRIATRSDVTPIVSMLADDELGQLRESFVTPLPDCYGDAFREIDCNPNQELLVADVNGEVLGVLHLTFVRTLTYRGGLRAQIEGVRVHRNHRGAGIGRQLFEDAIDRAKKRDAQLVELTTDKTRTDAAQFYAALGFVDSHVGMKLQLRSPSDA